MTSSDLKLRFFVSPDEALVMGKQRMASDIQQTVIGSCPAMDALREAVLQPVIDAVERHLRDAGL